MLFQGSGRYRDGRDKALLLDGLGLGIWEEVGVGESQVLGIFWCVSELVQKLVSDMQ